MSSVDQILEEWRNATNSANTANQERLDSILGLLEGQGASAIDQVNRDSAERTAGGDQSLIDRGLFNTTITDANRRREGESRTRQTNAINEGVALNKAGVLERVSDQGPDFGALMNLLSQFGQGAGANSGGRTFNFGGINRPEGPINPFGSSGSGGGGGGGGGGGSGSGSGGVQTFTNPGGGNPFENQTVQDAQAGAQGAQNQSGEDDPNLRTIPRTVWFQNPGFRLQGNFVYDARTGQLAGRRGN